MRDKATKLRSQIVKRLDELVNLVKSAPVEHDAVKDRLPPFSRAIVLLLLDDQVNVFDIAAAIAAGVKEGHYRVHPSSLPPSESPTRGTVTKEDITWALMFISQILQMYQSIFGK